jgi:transcriptional regulator with XRE-family HTH domain
MGRRLREIRTRRLLTQQALAAKAGLSLNTINRIEQGKFEPRFSTIHKLAGALGISPEELAGTAN